MELLRADRMNGVEEYFLAKALRGGGYAVKGRELINFGVGNPDLLPPEEVVNEIAASSKEAESHKYQPSTGSILFRRKAVEWYNKNFGVELDYESELISLLGVKDGIFHISLAYLNKGDKVFVPDPGYPVYSHTASLMQAVPVQYNLNSAGRWQVNIKELEEKTAGRVKIIWLNSPNMPTGSILEEKTFKAVINFARRNNILIVHDNPYSFILNGSKPFSILSIKGAKETAVELISLSKTYNMQGFRIAIAAGNAGVLDAIGRTKSITDSGGYLPIQHSAVKALAMKKGWVKKLNGIYAERKKEVEIMARMLGCETGTNNAGMFVWAKLPGNGNDVEFYADLLKRAGILVTPGSVYGKNGKGHIRISLCQPVEKIKIAQERINNLIKGKVC